MGTRGVAGLVLIFAARLASAQTVDVGLRPGVITVGDRIEARLTLLWDGAAPTAMPRFPAWQGTWGRAEVLAAGEVEATGDQAGRRIYTQTLVLTAFETGEIELPPRVVAVPLAGETVEVPTREGVRVTVSSVLPPAGESEGDGELAPRPAAPLTRLPGNRSFLWTTAVLLALCALAAWWLTRRLGPRLAAHPAAAEAALLSPLDELLEALRRLGIAAESERAHTAMSLALRRFLGRALDFHAVERTTSEIHGTLWTTRLPQELVQRAVTLLSDCDRVKFARADVTLAVTAERLERLRQLAHEIDASLRLPELFDDVVRDGATEIAA